MQSRGNLSSEHDRHDPVLVARYAAGDAYESEIFVAKDLVDNCDGCASLAADIRLISAKTAALPAATRPRDFRITPEQAEKLRGSWFDRLLRGFSTPGWSVVRPVAAASLAIGMVLIVVGALPISLTGGTSSEAVSGQNHASTGPGGGVPLATSLPAYAPVAAASAAPASAAASFTPQLAPAASTMPGAAGASGTFGAVDSASSMAASTAGPNPEAKQDNPSPEPPRLTSSSPTATEAAGKAVAGPSASPADLGGAAYGLAQVGSVNESTFDRSSLVLIGMVIAFLALMALGLVWLARRRSSDPLVR
jgi:hypothetical protein